MRAPLLLATSNPGKLRELRALASGLDVLTPGDVAPLPAVDENEDSLEGNARKKALAWAKASSLASLADDSGLFVDALQGRPGLHSARYAVGGDEARVTRLLEELQDVPEAARTAAFRCALCLAAPSGEWVVETGSCAGLITRVPRGAGGFGYDPVLFIPELQRTMAELSLDQKDRISHRGRAFDQLRPWLLAYRAGSWPGG